MRRLGLISDVHSNMPALRAVMEALEAEAVDAVYCAGDLVGYNPHPNEVVAEVRRRGVKTIAGNHERAALAGHDAAMNPIALEANGWTARALAEEHKAWMRGLDHVLRADLGAASMAMHHGAPDDRDRYVYPEHAHEELLHRAEAEVLVLGHTHFPFVREHGKRLIVNPGSVGQPRDGNPKASFAVLETRGGETAARIERVAYDIDTVARAIDAAGLPAPLAARLYLGR